MAGKDIAVKKYVVRLSAQEREQLQALVRKGKGPARRLLKARILLKADVSEGGPGWSDSKIIAALDTSASMLYRVRKQLVDSHRLLGFQNFLAMLQFATLPSDLTEKNIRLFAREVLPALQTLTDKEYSGLQTQAAE